MDGPITVERLKCCDWSVHKFLEENFSKLTDSSQIFWIGFVSIHYHLGEISCHIIECKIFWSIWTLYITTCSMGKPLKEIAKRWGTKIYTWWLKKCKIRYIMEKSSEVIIIIMSLDGYKWDQKLDKQNLWMVGKYFV